MEEGGFEPPKASPADLQSVPFGHSGTPPHAIFGAGGRIRTPDLLITNRFRHKNPGISMAFWPFSLQNQQLVPAIHSTVSTHKFRPVGQLVGQPTFRAESGLDDSDNSPKEWQKRRFDGYMVTPKSRKVKPSIFERSRQNKLFPSAIHHQTKQSPNQDPLKFCGGPPAIFGKGIL